MDRTEDARRASGSRKKFAVVEIEEPKKKSLWKAYLIVALLVVCLALSVGAGYILNAILNPPNKTMQVEQAAKTLGIPLTGDSLVGVTFVKSNPEGDSLNMTYKCTNCGYGGPTFVVQYPKEPGGGWRKHDLAPLTALSTPAAVAMEAQ